MSDHKSICMKDELKDDKEYSCACNECDLRLSPVKFKVEGERLDKRFPSEKAND